MSLCHHIEVDLYCQDIPEGGRFILNGTANLNYQLLSLEIQSQRVTTLRFFPRSMYICFFFKLSLREIHVLY